MAYIDSSLDQQSPLAALAGAGGPVPPETSDMGQPEEAGELLEDEPEAIEEEPASRRRGIHAQLVANVHDINIARRLDKQTLDRIGSAVMEEFRLDEQSRQDWVDDSEAAMKFALQKAEMKTAPWEGASNIIYPLIGQAALQFGATAYPTIIQNRNVVKGSVWGTDEGTPVIENGEVKMAPPQMGPDGQPGPPQPVWLIAPGEKKMRATKIGEHMSYQLLEEMPEWETQTDQLIHQIPIIGGAVRKTYFDPVERRNCSLYVSLMNLVWDYNAPSFDAAPRHSEKILLYPNEIVTRERSGRVNDDDEGMFLELSYQGGAASGRTPYNFRENAVPNQNDPDAPHMFIEQHRRWDLDDDGYAEPYIVTVHEASGQVVRIVARYDEDGIEMTRSRREVVCIKPTDMYTLYPFLPSLDGGSYPMGFGHWLKGINEAINTTLNQMFDAGTLQNTGGGFMADGIGVPSGPINFQVGKYVRVTTKGQSIRDSVMPLPFPGPSAVLFQLLGVLMEAGKHAAAIQSILAGDSSIANAPPTTVLALIEQGLKFYTAITKRLFKAMKSEYSKLYALNQKHIKEPKRYKMGDTWSTITPDDYRLGGGVEPIADPTMITDMQKLGRAQILMAYRGDPMVRQDKIALTLFDAAGFDRPEDLLAPPDPMAEQLKQMAMMKEMGEISRNRAAEQKDATQAFLNLANARKVANAQEEAFLDRQLEMTRLHIESINAAIRAAAVDAKFDGNRLRGEQLSASRAARATDGDPST